jgi:hypothetical protein
MIEEKSAVQAGRQYRERALVKICWQIAGLARGVCLSPVQGWKTRAAIGIVYAEFQSLNTLVKG